MKKSVFSGLKNNLWVIVMDIIAVNASFILALLLRYYVHSEFKSAALRFVDAYMHFAPFYTVICIVVFYICGLYDGIWRYAGLNDMNRIILASVITTIANVVGTKLASGYMPKSYYLVGGVLQFLMIVLIRFSYRFFQERRQRTEKRRDWTIPAMVVGSGDRAREFIRYLEENTPFQVALIAGRNAGKQLDGVTIVDYASIQMQLQYQGIQAVFIAEENLSDEEKSQILEAAQGVIVRDYIEFLSDMAVPAFVLLKYLKGPVTVVIDGTEKQYRSAQECLELTSGRYAVKHISGARIELEV